VVDGDWIAYTLADAPTYGRTRKEHVPHVRLEHPGEIIAGEVLGVTVRTWKSLKGDRPILRLRLARAFGEYAAGDVVLFELDLVGLRKWYDVEQPERGDTIVVSFDQWDGKAKTVRAKAVNRP
jgi:hypothetical protein